MKKLLLYFLLFISANSSAQNISVTDSIIKFGITEKGKPNGEKSEIKIDKNGGSIESSDGKVELIFPVGAVTKKMKVSIQPVINFAPNSTGNAYLMEPAGIVFEQPVQIIFHYRQDDTEGSAAGLMGIALQDNKGFWSPLKNVLLDTVSKTIKADIQHFSSYVNYMWSKLKPVSAKVKVNGSLRLNIVTLAPLDEFEENELLEPLTKPGKEVEVAQVWRVNNIAKGNSTIGFISASQNNSAIYQAPSLVPEQNPVAVTVEHSFYSAFLKNKNITKLVSNILIYGDAWEVNMISEMKGGSIESWGGLVTYSDVGSFTVSLEKNKCAIIGIKNHMETLTSNCSKIVLNPNTCTGLFHVAGAKSIKVTPANPPALPYPLVEIFFIPHPIELTQFKFTCPPPPGVIGGSTGTFDLSQRVMQMFYKTPAIPQYLKFEARDGVQVLAEAGSPGSELYYKIWIEKIK